MGKKINNRAKALIVTLIFFSCIICVGIYFMIKPTTFVFINNNPEVQIHCEFDALANIKKVRDGKISQVVVDQSKLNINALGEYPVKYTYKEKTTEIIVSIVDKKSPTFDIVELEIDLGMKVDPNLMAINIVDDTKTTVKFKKDYKFDKVGDVKVVVVVIDQAGNKVEKKGVVHVLEKDDIAPEIKGVSTRTISKGDLSVDLLSGITVLDNRDPGPQLNVDQTKMDINKLGEYEVKYIATDRSGNKTETTCIIKVVEKAEIGVNTQTESKIVYLTFDDGPSYITEDILNVLDQYGVKATFFATGLNPDYFYLIKEAYNRGHTIGMHTYSHNYSQLYASPEAYYEDLNKIGELCKQQIGFVPRYIRFPGGSSNGISKKFNPGIMSFLTKDVLTKGYQYYDWNADFQDGSGKLAASTLFSKAIDTRANNVIILAHDARGKQTTVEALPKVIEYYRSNGYAFAGIDDFSYVPHHRVNN